jgi:hypothetical protein
MPDDDRVGHRQKLDGYIVATAIAFAEDIPMHIGSGGELSH